VLNQDMVVHRADPLNCETSVAALIGGVVMPNARFYVRNHFQTPALDASAWRLEVTGLVGCPLSLSLRELSRMPVETRVVTLECAGNGRYRLEPPVDGEPWRLGAVSTAEWTGEVLPAQHGYPVRLVVPSWYGVASVKWLTAIELAGRPFDGYFQAVKYCYEAEGTPREPVTLQRVRALITDPREGEELRCGEITVRGVAWSGAAPIARVEVSINQGPWQEARLIGDRRRHSWQWWELLTNLGQPGENSIRARATDLDGRTQPGRPPWNRHGYGNNAIQQVDVQLTP